jgi:hypothetical protein
VELHPEVGDPVVLRVQPEGEYRSRLESLGDGLLVVQRPSGLPVGATFGPGTELDVAWADADGAIRVLPTRILAAHAEGTMPLWSLIVSGPASVDQRRRFVRVAAAGPVALRPVEGGGAVTGNLVDVSEGAVRCTVRAGAADRFLTGDNQVVAEFHFGTGDFAVGGRVEFLRPTTRPAELEDVVVLFDEPVAEVDELRAQLVAQQAEEPTADSDDE